MCFLKLRTFSKHLAVHSWIALSTEPFKGHGGEKNLGWEERIFFKCFAFSRKDIYVLSQNQLSSDKLFLFTLQLAVVTASMFTMERFIGFYFELGLKVIQSVLSSRHGFWDILKRLKSAWTGCCCRLYFSVVTYFQQKRNIESRAGFYFSAPPLCLSLIET